MAVIEKRMQLKMNSLPFSIESKTQNLFCENVYKMCHIFLIINRDSELL